MAQSETATEMQKQFIRDIQHSNIRPEWKQIILNQFRIRGWTYVRELMTAIMLMEKYKNQ